LFTSNPFSYDLFRVAAIAVYLVIEPPYLFGRDRVCQFCQNFPQRRDALECVLPHEIDRFVRREVMAIVGELKQVQSLDAAIRSTWFDDSAMYVSDKSISRTSANFNPYVFEKPG
jgi:hypothetical protein